MTVATTAALPRIYVCGHRNPDTDSIASAIGYAELKNQVDEGREYVPVRLGVANAQTEWLHELKEMVRATEQFRIAELVVQSREDHRHRPAGDGCRKGDGAVAEVQLEVASHQLKVADVIGFV